MTFYYDSETNLLVGNNALAFAEFRDYSEYGDEELVIDPEQMSRGVGKLTEMQSAIGSAIRANDEDYNAEGDVVTYVDEEGTHQTAIVVKDWGGGTVNLLVTPDGKGIGDAGRDDTFEFHTSVQQDSEYEYDPITWHH